MNVLAHWLDWRKGARNRWGGWRIVVVGKPNTLANYSQIFHVFVESVSKFNDMVADCIHLMTWPLTWTGLTTQDVSYQCPC